jgi:hypothetical protein
MPDPGPTDAIPGLPTSPAERLILFPHPRFLTKYARQFQAVRLRSDHMQHFFATFSPAHVPLYMEG